ncbi:sulfatase-like hydrolase/transferase [Glycomyces sp. A-F 0318]|uniref:sulfatase-like hydrolase/transferase n=1 Tax=Glycomyces amatae TaxID=2881355 RepID=UPI001E2AC1A3|nr:sulfatase-like hydrolase/transferase [Glycomyces amatae]MCD0447304.1 sulfatase-like hydrolase/transferase [Glycomyces amatae]
MNPDPQAPVREDDPRTGRPPHIVLVMTDQQRADFSARYGFPVDTTPFLDGLAERGSDFHRAYTSSPLCVPARESLLTGRYPSAHRVTQNSTERAAHYGADLLDVLGGAGYRRVFAGKPHMHRGPDDFDAYHGPYWHTGGPQRSEEHAAFDRWLDELDHGVADEPTPFPLEASLPHRIVSDAIGEITAADAETPVFLWVSFPEPHNPYQVPEPYFGMFPPETIPDRAHGPEAAEAKGGHWRWLRELVDEKRPGYDEERARYRANYCGQLRLLDDQVRRLMDHVHATLGDDVLVIMVSDHGDYVAEYGLQRKGAGLPEVLVRIPFFFSGARVAPARREEMVSIVDVLPTIAELAGLDIPDGVSGRSLAPLLADAELHPDGFDEAYAERGYGGLTYGPGERPPLHFPYEGRTFDELNSVTQSGRSRMIRHRDAKLIVHSDGTGELYDLADDPAEVHDRFADPAYAPLRAELLWRLCQWMLRTQDELPRGAYTPKRAPHNWTPPLPSLPHDQGEPS